MSRDRGKPFESTVSINIIPDVSGLMAAFSRFEDMVDRISGRRYKTSHDGRVHRLPGKKPLLHKGGKP